ncbi:hypothetical protein [Halopelagius longus]|uniref:Uncharacterized protein n=1 Tax=Halopelagius longus TaxID=1236180 RepID=A0A1H0Z6F6_9EURY|nr:hypothetical protein [Halopelagius longus]RDI72856.1 hypothetical protein DWB78_14605 [Halopelagius longus]SDQ23049.1 hypothetical protein SAMN05216278_1044 [Halopelagius longus]
MPERVAVDGLALRLVAVVSVAVVALLGVGAVATLLVGAPDRSTLAVAAVVLGSVCALGLYAARTVRRTETPYWRS